MLITAGTASAEIKIRSRQTIAGQAYESTVYIKGKRQRTEAMNGATINITQCDLRRAIQLNPAAKTFVVNEFGKIESSDQGGKVESARTLPSAKGGVVVTTINVKDTGERKQMFGMQARRLVITMDTRSSPGSCSKVNTRMELDGWYVDLDASFDCEDAAQYNGYKPKASGGCQDQYETHQTGGGKRGYALFEKMTIFDVNGAPSTAMVNEVVELSRSPIDAALFEIPEGYRELSDPSQLHLGAAASANRSAASVINAKPATETQTATRGEDLPSVPANATTGPGEKKAGVIRIGLVGVKTGPIGASIPAADLAAAVQNSMAEHLTGPNIEIVFIGAKVASLIEAEAREKECDLVLNATVSHKKGGGFGSMFGSALGATIARTGLGHTGSTIGNVAGQVAAQAIISAALVSENVRSKDEITLEIKLDRAGEGTKVARAFKAKAKSDGDDIISQVVEQAAQAVISALGR